MALSGPAQLTPDTRLTRVVTGPVLAWTAWGFWLVLAAAVTWFGIQAQESDAKVAFCLLGYATVGALVASRHPRNAVGWLLIAFAVSLTIGLGGPAYVEAGLDGDPGLYPGYEYVAWLAASTWSVPVLIILVFVPMLFPEGRLPSRNWVPILWLGIAGAVALLVGSAFRPGRLDEYSYDAIAILNPFGVDGSAGKFLVQIGNVGVGLALITWVLAGLGLLLQFRRSHGIQRQQLKWFTIAMGLIVAGFALAFFLSVVHALIDDTALGRADWWGAVEETLWFVFLFDGTLGIPLALAFAMFRYRLYDIDLVINRTLVYGLLTATSLAAYAAFVVVLRQVFSPFVPSSEIAVAISTLAVAALFQPARSWIQRAIDRRFFRRRYDATRVLNDFAARLRHDVDLDAVGADLCAAAKETVQPSHVSLWLRP